MRVVDTSSWIEWFADSPVGRRLIPYMPTKEKLLVPTIVQLELTKWLMRVSPSRLADAIRSTNECHVIVLDTPIALRAASIGREYKLATADAVIYATALEHDADLLTCDAHFTDLPGVLYIPKIAS